MNGVRCCRHRSQFERAPLKPPGRPARLDGRAKRGPVVAREHDSGGANVVARNLPRRDKERRRTAGHGTDLTAGTLVVLLKTHLLLKTGAPIIAAAVIKGCAHGFGHAPRIKPKRVYGPLLGHGHGSEDLRLRQTTHDQVREILIGITVELDRFFKLLPTVYRAAVKGGGNGLAGLG